jgi:hypothetical protein
VVSSDGAVVHFMPTRTSGDSLAAAKWPTPIALERTQFFPRGGKRDSIWAILSHSKLIPARRDIWFGYRVGSIAG